MQIIGSRQNWSTYYISSSGWSALLDTSNDHSQHTIFQFKRACSGSYAGVADDKISIARHIFLREQSAADASAWLYLQFSSHGTCSFYLIEDIISNPVSRGRSPCLMGLLWGYISTFKYFVSTNFFDFSSALSRLFTPSMLASLCNSYRRHFSSCCLFLSLGCSDWRVPKTRYFFWWLIQNDTTFHVIYGRFKSYILSCSPSHARCSQFSTS